MSSWLERMRPVSADGIEELEEKLDDLEKIAKKLDNIEKKLDEINKRLDKLEKKLKQFIKKSKINKTKDIENLVKASKHLFDEWKKTQKDKKYKEQPERFLIFFKIHPQNPENNKNI